MLHEKRLHKRVKTSNLVSYLCIGENNEPLSEQLGEVLDISLGGLKLQTNIPIDTEYVRIISVNIKDEIEEIKAEVVYCNEIEPNLFHAGIRFVASEDRKQKFVAQLVREYHGQK